MKWKIFLISMVLTLSGGVYPTGIMAQNEKQAAQDMPAEILRLVNVYRAGMGLRPLTMNKIVARAAANHSHNMATKKVPFGHDGFDARTDAIKKQLRGANAFAENVAYGARTAQEALDMWLHSAGHKQNIEGNYNLTGIGIAKGPDGTLYFTQIFVGIN